MRSGTEFGSKGGLYVIASDEDSSTAEGKQAASGPGWMTSSPLGKAHILCN